MTKTTIWNNKTDKNNFISKNEEFESNKKDGRLLTKNFQRNNKKFNVFEMSKKGSKLEPLGLRKTLSQLRTQSKSTRNRIQKNSNKSSKFFFILR